MTNIDAFNSRAADREPHTYLVGAGVASLAAAVFLIRDGDVVGRDITILEESDVIGGSLDGAGTAEHGYVLRGGRMLESHYACTFDLFASIPTLDGSRTVTQETMAWNETLKTSSKSRLMIDGKRLVAPAFGMSESHILTIERLAVEPEVLLGRSRIDQQFDSAFFDTNFWIMWRTTFAFQPWHSAVEFKRYLVRFAHMVEGFDRLKGILRTVYNQYESFVRPLRKWLDERGVVFAMNTTVCDLCVFDVDGVKRIDKIMVRREGSSAEILVRPIDRVLVTLGSMTEASSLGAMDAAPVRPSQRVRRSRRSIEVGLLHSDDERSPASEYRPRSHGQRAGRGWIDHLREIGMARLHRHPASTPFRRAAGGRQRVLGIWVEHGRARRLR
jgi:oleate hydratase